MLSHPAAAGGRLLRHPPAPRAPAPARFGPAAGSAPPAFVPGGPGHLLGSAELSLLLRPQCAPRGKRWALPFHWSRHWHGYPAARLWRSGLLGWNAARCGRSALPPALPPEQLLPKEYVRSAK